VELVDLEYLLERADFVCVCSALTVETRHMLSSSQLRAMKRTAYLINVSRGALLDEEAIVEVLREGGIAGAGLDVFEEEPLRPDSPLTGLPNVILTPHNLPWTEECFVGNGRGAAAALKAVARGQVPVDIANLEVLEQPRFVAALADWKHAAKQFG
jgi:phosphoglycerate dehydrogenase-like enzyme